MKINFVKDPESIVLTVSLKQLYQLNNKYSLWEEGGEDLSYISNNVKLYIYNYVFGFKLCTSTDKEVWIRSCDWMIWERSETLNDKINHLHVTNVFRITILFSPTNFSTLPFKHLNGTAHFLSESKSSVWKYITFSAILKKLCIRTRK